ncbi:hypothetical protein TGME49_258225 [Toxoplasma gondii ME49]|uniref:Secreted protein n=2 Tax=Toxoplasma gondii TaxID=5811 RepID=A0A125YJA8_TOXGV|nr:hypothetical protein TGME49_258225 [Toxoplasma gondii ME49]EPT29330.1 hypothetical protein TGME49_258225 [Toxoplasma gondii ME49]ESS32183.1 hypothetical protein TGVEG_258225 [Toxoplasma gondii VEG]|eukprot:XP_018637006.1 hypothetical protein TGME49_258225 [Toxoplasma gondii ME49]
MWLWFPCCQFIHVAAQHEEKQCSGSAVHSGRTRVAAHFVRLKTTRTCCKTEDGLSAVIPLVTQCAYQPGKPSNSGGYFLVLEILPDRCLFFSLTTSNTLTGNSSSVLEINELLN